MAMDVSVHVPGRPTDSRLAPSLGANDRAADPGPGRSGSVAVAAVTGLAFLLLGALAAWQASRELSNQRVVSELAAQEAVAWVAGQVAQSFTVGNLLTAQAAQLVDDAPLTLASGPALRPALADLAAAAPAVETLWVGDADGQAVASSHGLSWGATRAVGQGFFAALKDGSVDVHIGRLPQSGRRGTPLLVASRRLETADGGFRGFVAATIEPGRLQPMLEGIGGAGALTVWLLDQELLPMLRHPSFDPAAIRRGALAQAFGRIDGQNQGLIEVTGPVTRAPMIYAFRKLPGFEAFALAGLPEAAVTRRWLDELPALAAPFLVAGTAVGVLGALGIAKQRRGARRWQRLASDLQDQARRLGAERTARETADRELGHRIKNVLQIVTSLLYLQRSTVRHPEALAQLDEAAARVMAVARAHGRLRRTDNSASVPVKPYLEQLCLDIEQGLPTRGTHRIVCDIADGELAAETVIPLALITSELVADRLKQGTAAGREGVLTVRFSRTADGDAVLAVRSRAPPHPAADLTARPAASLEVVRRLARQLGGTMRVDETAGGWIEVELPARILTA